MARPLNLRYHTSEARERSVVAWLASHEDIAYDPLLHPDDDEAARLYAEKHGERDDDRRTA